MRAELALIGFFIATAASNAFSASEGDPRLIGRWCSKEVTLYLADGTSTTGISDESQHTKQTFSADRVFVEWVHRAQSAHWIQSYELVAPGRIAVKTLEHSSFPPLVGTNGVVQYEIEGQTLRLISYPQELKPEPLSTHRKIESVWARCK